MHVTRGLPEPSLVWLGPLPEHPALLPARGKPRSREERRGRLAHAKGPCLSMDRAWKMGHPSTGTAEEQGSCLSARDLHLSQLPLLPCGKGGQHAWFSSS